MSKNNNRRLYATGTGLLGAALVGLLAISPARVQASECSELPTALRSDPLSAAGFQVRSAQKLFRTQDRPWAQIPTGARLTLRAPAGVTAADLHRALQCTAGQNSPLAVSGAQLELQRVGDSYRVQITAASRSAALEIQRRVEALTSQP